MPGGGGGKSRRLRDLDFTKEFGQIPYMTRSTLTSKHQTTIPKSVVEALKLQPSDQLIYEIEADGRVVLSAKTGSFQQVAEVLKKKGRSNPIRSEAEMKKSLKQMAVKRYSRSKS